MNKKFTTGVLLVCLVASLLCGCKSKKTKTEDPTTNNIIPAETTAPAPTETPTTKGDGLKDAVSKVQNFSTKCKEEYNVIWDDKDGLYIETENDEGIPYVLIYRAKDCPIDAKQYLEESFIVSMQERYGDNLISVTPIDDAYTCGGKTFSQVTFKYIVDDTSIESFLVCGKYGNDIVTFNAKTIAGENEETMDALKVAIENFTIGTGKDEKETTKPVETPDGVKVKKTANADVVYEEYVDPSGYFTINIPKGWEVAYDIPGFGRPDLISFYISVYNPQDLDCRYTLCLSTAGNTKSAQAKEWYQRHYPKDMKAILPYVEELTTEAYFKAMSGADAWGYTDFNLVENIGKTPLNGDLLYATAKSSLTGNEIAGNFTGFVTNGYTYNSGGIDLGTITVYTVIIETAQKDEFLNWQPVLDKSFSTLQFTKKFQEERAELWKKIMGTASTLAANGDAMSDMIMDSWEKRNKTYDISSEKTSDTTLGYERVYDTETGEVYRAYNGFTDDYSGTRFKPLENDNMYCDPVVGYIDK